MKPTQSSAEKASPARWPHRRFRPFVEARGRTPGAVPGGLLGMLVLVAAVEVVLTRGGCRFVDPVSYSWAYSGRASTARAPAADLLFLGDSLVKHGLAPRVFAAVTGRRSYNLATPAAPSPLTYFLFRRAVDAGASPTAVVFDLKPSLQIGGPNYSVRKFAEVLGACETIHLGAAERSVPFATELVLERVFASYRWRFEIRNEVLAALRGETGPTLAANAVSDRNWTVNDGVNLSHSRPGYDGGVTEPEHDHLISRGFYANPVNAGYTRRLLALAAGRGIRTYLLLPPFVPDLNARRRQTGAETKYTAYVRTLRDGFPGLTVLDARESGYPPSVFVDPIHLDARGTLALSDDVAAVLRDDLDATAGPGRWVRLPAYRERPRPADLEDTEVSRARLERAHVR